MSWFTSVSFIVLPAVLFALEAESAATPHRSEIIPLADHHVHLLGPYALPLPDPLPPPVELPEELAGLLERRAALIGRVGEQEGDLDAVFTRDAQLLEAHLAPNRWLRDRVWFERYLNLGQPGRARFVPNQYRQSGDAGFIAGTVLDEPSGVHVANFLLGIERGENGQWRIAADSTTPKRPPRYPAPVTADMLIAELDEAGVRRALVLSEAFWLAGPGAGDVRRMREAEDEQSAVRGENDWTAQQVARYPDRLVFAAAVGALEDYSIEEIRRCVRELGARAVKLNFSGSVDFHDPQHVAKLRALFREIGELGVGVVLHLEPGRPYGREEVEIFLRQIVSAAPNTPIQIAHLAGNGPGVSSPEALAVFAELRAAGDPRTANLYFDLGGVLYEGLHSEQGELIAQRIRRLGVDRVLFGSDRMPGTENPPIHDQWTWLRRHVPLTDEELLALATNVPPYMR